MGIFAKGIAKHYKLGKIIGEGSFAVVKVGTCLKTGERVALKVINKLDADYDEEFLDREIMTMKKGCEHPNCVRLYSVWDEPKKTYLVLELLTGGTVMDRIVETDHFSERQAAKVTSGVLMALEHIHSLGIAHRDLKPENLMYKSHDVNSPDYDTVKVADFGLANWNFSRKGTMRTACGTPNYIAPEVILVDEGIERTTYGTAVDVWSLGVVLYVMLCGFAPFTHENTAALFNMITKGDYTFPSPYWDGISDQAKHLVSQMLNTDPETRETASMLLKHPWIQDAHVNASGDKLHSSHRAFMLIRKLPIFDRVDPQCLQEVTRRLRVVRADKGDCVIRAGDYGDCMYFLSDGAVQVLYAGREIDRLYPGDFFGEIALTVAEKRVADVFALGAPREGSRAEIKNVPVEKLTGPTELFQLSRTDFEDIMQQFPIVRTRLAESGQIKQRLRSVHEVQRAERGKGASSEEGSDDEAGPSSAAGGASTAETPEKKKGMMGKISSMFK
mmetsp:Transcript_39194/g.57605  ORF Transcript_39194/g.57605 Transcript_39194/m.57605 type:complete len:501 (-) Transcript_39194:211-1713(-)|eukprot:CAMPEP_0179428878 /NCGR_PEP_ID=MMETSP0799-20121207/14425_1 /TAXON_ID=46947 /ORGANISM="Geminigera cryophila, Strain CCMP2564" /LENGTH=500 /DNA_ID=CAMNT_0021204563 /DNA_START=95 /DNA_END=1597 /DNA_ORIENTATION=-